MANSDFVFDQGDPVTVGAAGQHDLAFAGGDSVTDEGESTLVFEEGTGLGGKFAGIFARAIVQNSESGVDPHTTAINGENIDATRVQLVEGLDEGVQDRAIIDYEDADDFDYQDCRLTTDQSMLESDGYVTIVLEHLNAGNFHEWWLGETKADGYYVGEHSGTNDTVVFTGRMYDNEEGTVTDENGNKLGEWK